jgi:putative transposase
MKLIAQLKLVPTSEQTDALRRTLETANAACTDISRLAWHQQTFSKCALKN